MISENDRWELLTIVQGELQSQLIISLLEAHQVPIITAEEGSARAIGLYNTPLANVAIYVPKKDYELAWELLTTSGEPIQGFLDDGSADEDDIDDKANE